MDKIYIEDLEVYGYHGAYQEEKSLGQKFIISVEIGVNLKNAGISDCLSETIDYGKLCKEVASIVRKSKFDLIEKLAEVIAEHILINYSLAENVKILVKKPWAPIGENLKHVSVEIYRSWHNAYIGIGSNIGDKNSYINSSIDMIKTQKIKLREESSRYVTSPISSIKQDDFINCVVKIETLLEPLELIDFLMYTEKKLKRDRTVKWGPRTIDLDILLYDNYILNSEKLIVPHPRMQDRLFVLVPLCELIPNYVHPVLNKSIETLKSELEKTQELYHNSK